MLETIRILRRELADRVPLIGFGGAPFTMAAYAIEGGPSTTYSTAKAFMYAQPEAWHRLCDRFARLVADYMRAQIEAGVQAVQIFDSWVGQLSRADYVEFALPHTRRIFDAPAPASRPSTSASHRRAPGGLGGGRRRRIGVDWRSPIDEAWTGPDHAIQGNLDPVRLLGPADGMLPPTTSCAARRPPRPHFNLGHGVLPDALATFKPRRHVHGGSPRVHGPRPTA